MTARHLAPATFRTLRREEVARRDASPLLVVDGRGVVPLAPPVPARAHHANAVAVPGRATLVAEYRGLGIDPALIDIIERATPPRFDYERDEWPSR